MVAVFVKSICRSVFSVGKPWPRIPLFLSSHSSGIPTIMVGTFIVLEDPSSVIEVVTRTFIALDGPPEASEGIIVIIEGCTPTEKMSGISCPMEIPSNPPDVIATPKYPAHGDHF